MAEKYEGNEDAILQCDRCEPNANINRLKKIVNEAMKEIKETVKDLSYEHNYHVCEFCDDAYYSRAAGQGRCATCRSEMCPSCAKQAAAQHGEAERPADDGFPLHPKKCDGCTGVLTHSKIDEALELIEGMNDAVLTKAVEEMRTQLEKRKAVQKVDGEPDAKRQKVEN
jgi:hypothetical protein